MTGWIIFGIFFVYLCFSEAHRRITETYRSLNYRLITMEEAIESLDRRIDDIEDNYRPSIISEHY